MRKSTLFPNGGLFVHCNNSFIVMSTADLWEYRDFVGFAYYPQHSWGYWYTLIWLNQSNTWVSQAFKWTGLCVPESPACAFPVAPKARQHFARRLTLVYIQIVELFKRFTQSCSSRWVNSDLWVETPLPTESHLFCFLHSTCSSCSHDLFSSWLHEGKSFWPSSICTSQTSVLLAVRT